VNGMVDNSSVAMWTILAMTISAKSFLPVAWTMRQAKTIPKRH
jgi:hypothetical protein